MRHSLKGHDFVIFLSQDWDTFFRRHLIRTLADCAPDSKFLCLERPVCPITNPFLKPYKFLQWITGRGNIRQVRENLIIYRPFILLHDHIATKISPFNKINRLLLKSQIRRWNKKYSLNTNFVVSWIYDPFQDGYLNLVNEQLKVFEYYDEYSSWSEVPFFRTHKDLARKEKQVLSEVDLVFVVSEEILTNKSHLHRSIHVVPNATDFGHFNKAAKNNLPLPNDIAPIKRPIVGYVGNITSRIDFSLLEYLSKNHSDWSFVFIGGTDGVRIPATLKSKTNVNFLGSKPYEELPKYMKFFDVCIIPYDQNDPFNINCSPLKLYDYLATGKPIVSTDLPAVRYFKEFVRIADDPEDFGQQVKKALEEHDRHLCKLRIAKAQENSWEFRANDIINILNDYYKGNRE